MSATNDNGMGDVATDEVDEDVLTVTQGIHLPHVVGDEVTGYGYPLGTLFTAVALPLITNMGAVVAIGVYGATTCGINDAGAHKTC